MIKNHVVGAGLTALAMIISLCVGLMWLAGQASPLVLSTVAILIVLGVTSGLLIPGILLTWLLIGTVTLSASILLVGYVAIVGWQKILLLGTYPLVATLVALARQIIGGWGWLAQNRAAINHYAQHYNATLKLQTQHNAAKYYHKETRFITREMKPARQMTVTLIHWAHYEQFRQLQAEQYQEHLQAIGRVLKTRRFPSEQLYYLGQADFLIISTTLDAPTLAAKDRETKAALAQVGGSQQLQFKWGQLQVDQQNVAALPTLALVLRRLRRQLETDLVVEYLKEVPAHG